MVNLTTVATALFAFVACTVTPAPTGAATEEHPSALREMSREGMFAALTSHRWCDDPSLAYTNDSPPAGAMPSVELTLRGDGTYRAYELNDTIERPRPPGVWNFVKVGPRAGVLYLADHKRVTERTVIFEFVEADRLQVHGLWGSTPVGTFLRCQPLQDARKRRAADLPEVAMDPEVRALGGSSWKLVSEIVSPVAARVLEFLPDGRVHETLPAAGCTEEMQQALYGRPVSNERDGTCRKEHPFGWGRFRKTDRFVVDRTAVYLPSADEGKERYLFLGFVPEIIEGVASYVPPIRRNPLPVRIEIWNAGTDERHVGKLSISELSVTGAGRHERELAAITFDDLLRPGQARSEDVLIDRPSPPGGVWNFTNLSFRLEMGRDRSLPAVIHTF